MKSSKPFSEAAASATNDGGTASGRPRLMNATPRNASPKRPAPEPSAKRSGPVIVDYLEEFPPWLQEREGEDAT